MMYEILNLCRLALVEYTANKDLLFVIPCSLKTADFKLGGGGRGKKAFFFHLQYGAKERSLGPRSTSLNLSSYKVTKSVPLKMNLCTDAIFCS